MLNNSRGDCGHIKVRWDNHHSCLSCSSCYRISTCYICSQWSDGVWILAEKRRIHATRRSVMTKKRDNKTKKRNVPDSSDTISIDGSTAPHAFTARGRTHLGGSPVEWFSKRAISPPVTGKPDTSQPVTGQLVTGHPGTSHPGTSHQSTSQPVTGQPGTSQPVTGHPFTGHQSTRHWSFRHQSIFTRHQSSVRKYGKPGTGHRAPGAGQFITYQHSPSSSHRSLDSSHHILLP